MGVARGAVVSAVATQSWGWRHLSKFVCVGSLQVFLLLPTFQRHAIGGQVKDLLKSDLTREGHSHDNKFNVCFGFMFF